jgi:hypothetical protein
MGGSDLFTEEKKEKKTEKVKEEKPKAETKKEEKMPDDDLFEEDIPIEDIESILGELGVEEPKEEKKAIKEEPKETKKIKQEKKKKTSPQDFLAEFEDFFALDTTKKKKRKIIEEKAERVAHKEKKEDIPRTEFSTEEIEELLMDSQPITTNEPVKEVSKGITEDVTRGIKAEEPVSHKKPEPVKATGDISQIISSNGALKIELTLSQEELKQLIVNATVEKMVEELKEDRALKELIQTVERTFIERTEKELEGLKEIVKKEVKTRLLRKIEEDLKESIKESIKKDVMEITTKLVKQKLEQLFGK